MSNKESEKAMKINLDKNLPRYPEFKDSIRRTPSRGFHLTQAQTKIAIKNALRYVPEELHEILAPEFMEELRIYGRIYAYRLQHCPLHESIWAA